MSAVDQKEYLKKYLGIGRGSGDKKKKKKSKKITSNGLKIVDDDVDISLSREIQEDLEADNEDTPQIVSVIDDRPPSLRVDEVTQNLLWKPIGAQEISSDSAISLKFESNIKLSKKLDNSKHLGITSLKNSKSDSYKQLGNKIQASSLKDRDFSPPRKRKNSDSDNSPPRHKKTVDNSPIRRKNTSENSNRGDGQAKSPPRKSRRRNSEDYSPPRRNRREVNYSPPNSSPPRRASNNDNSPPRKSRRKYSETNSPPRINQEKSKDSSPPRRAKKDGSGNSSPQKSEDCSPPRKPRKIDDDNSPPRKNRSNIDSSPPKRIKREKSMEKSPSRSARRQDDDYSPPTRIKVEKNRGSSPSGNIRNSSSHSRKKSRWGDEEEQHDKLKKTLDGKKAGLQSASDLVQETNQLKKREEELFKNLSAEVSGANAATVVRHKKKEIDWEEEERKRKREEENKEKYDKWGKGLKQVEDRNEKIKNELYEMSKPLARYADDEDLEKYLKDQEREGDPMLAYIRQKKKKNSVEDSKPVTQQYQGDAPPNRFGIRPGYRWDGVDRSNGYEKQWFQIQNSRKASMEESYKWSIEDM